MLNGRIVHVFRVVLITINNVDFWQHLDITYVKYRASGVDLVDSGFKVGLATDNYAQIAFFRGLEGVQRGGVGFGAETGRANAIVQNDHNATPHGLLVGGNGDRIQQVHWAVGADGRGRAHRGGKHHRFVALDRQIKKVRRFVQRIGSVRDHHAIHITA
ncbi:hypothetical protein D3C72_1427910 [compost metagenome]